MFTKLGFNIMVGLFRRLTVTEFSIHFAKINTTRLFYKLQNAYFLILFIFKAGQCNIL